MANKGGFTSPIMLFGSSGCVAADAYNVVANYEGLNHVCKNDLVQAVRTGDPKLTAEAFRAVLVASEQMALMCAALQKTAARIKGMDEFDWHALEADQMEDIVRRDRIMDKIADTIEAYVS